MRKGDGGKRQFRYRLGTDSISWLLLIWAYGVHLEAREGSEENQGEGEQEWKEGGN